MPYPAFSRPAGALIVLLAASLPLLACDGAPGRDEARTDATPDTARWSLAPTPRVRIGASQGAPGHDLHRVFAGLITADGRIVVGNSGTGEVRFFDPRGRYLSATGREGAGPGEFRGIHWMAPFRGDSIAVFDAREQRFTILGPGGAFVRSFRSEAAPGPLMPVGVFSDGSILVAVEGQFDPRRVAGTVRDTLSLFRIAPTGAVLGPLGRFPGAEWLRYDHAGSFRATQLPFGRAAHLAVTGDRFVYGTSDSDRLRVYDRSGAQVGTLELPGKTRKLTEEEVSESLESAVDDAAQRTAIRRRLDRQDDLKRAPVFSALRADRDGNLWVQLFPAPGGGPSKWLVMTPVGKWVGSLHMPPDHLPLDIRSGTLLVRETDAQGVQRVALHQVVR